MPKVKICGITTLADARTALLAGADFLGFIFYLPSPRSVTTAQAAAIVASLRAGAETGPLLSPENGPRLIGVFVNEPATTIATILTDCGLDLAQLSGDEPPEVVSGADSPIRGRAYQALRPRSMAETGTVAAAYSALTPPSAPTLLIDTYHAALRGGTGETADWGLAAELGVQTPRLMLAGGLTPNNVAAAIDRAHPFAVDVASGVEARPGRKDRDKVQRFIAAAKAAGE